MKDTYGDQYLLSTFVRRITSVAELPAKRAQVERHVRTVDPVVVADHLQEVVGAAVRGQDIALDVLFAVVGFLIHSGPELQGPLDRLDLAARETERWSVAWLLLEPAPHRVAEHLTQVRRHERALTLGERRAFAAGWKPHMLDRLLRDNDPMVVERLCNNPRITRDHILTIATRRPTAAPLLTELLKHPRWLRDPQVRESVAHNPYAETALALRMLPLLPIDAVHRLRFATDLHPLVAEAGAHFMALRDGDVLPVPEHAVGRGAPDVHPLALAPARPDTPLLACDIPRRLPED